MLKKIINWFITSSANPQETSMTVQSLLLVGAGDIVQNLQSLGLNVTLASYTTDIGHAAVVLGLLLSGIGFARKIFLTVQSKAK